MSGTKIGNAHTDCDFDSDYPDKGDIVRCDTCGQHWICTGPVGRTSYGWNRIGEKQVRKLMQRRGARPESGDSGDAS